ncbi:MAG: hypothetical protein O9284_17205 [Steroidobacteraceae bacterium]|nr:hypothetical protein [Steroidobacteraceae bacterium]
MLRHDALFLCPRATAHAERQVGACVIVAPPVTVIDPNDAGWLGPKKFCTFGVTPVS